MYSLDTPESVAVGYDVAGVGTRFLAALIDTALQTLILIAFAVVTLVTGTTLHGASAYAIVAIGIFIINAVLLGYYIFFELIWNGQSPGKRAMRLRVIQTSGYPVTPFAVLIRNVLRLIDFLPALYGFGVITMIANSRARRLGDLMAGTLVIKEGRDVNLSSLSAPSPTMHVPPYASSPDPEAAALLAGARIDLLTREDEALIRDFLHRRASLTSRRRAELAGQIAEVVHRRIGGPSLYNVTPARSAERYLEMVLAARAAP